MYIDFDVRPNIQMANDWKQSGRETHRDIIPGELPGDKLSWKTEGETDRSERPKDTWRGKHVLRGNTSCTIPVDTSRVSSEPVNILVG